MSSNLLRITIPTTRRAEHPSTSKRPFTIFNIQVQRVGGDGLTWTIERRYVDFNVLHVSLMGKFPVSMKEFLASRPPFPRKKIMGTTNMSSRTVEERRVFFQSYLQGLVELNPRPADVNAFLQIPATQPTITTSSSPKVTLHDFELLETLGTGAFGRVFLVRKHGGAVPELNGNLYAMKVLVKADVKARKQVTHTLTELDVMSTMRHPFIARLLFAFHSSKKLFLVSEFYSGGELFFHLREYQHFTEPMVRFYCSQVVLALQHLHAQQIVYRDLKPENVLLDMDGNVKITDFGLSKKDVSESQSGAKTICGTPEYQAPEQVLQEPEYGFSVDWWSLGVFTFELFVGVPPFVAASPRLMQQNILNAKPHFPVHLPQPSVELRDVIFSLLKRDPNSRLGSGARDAQHVMEHGFFTSVNWDDVLAKKIAPPILPRHDPDHLNFDPNQGPATISNDSLPHQYDNSKTMARQTSSSPSRRFFRYLPLPGILVGLVHRRLGDIHENMSSSYNMETEESEKVDKSPELNVTSPLTENPKKIDMEYVRLFEHFDYVAEEITETEETAADLVNVAEQAAARRTSKLGDDVSTQMGGGIGGGENDMTDGDGGSSPRISPRHASPSDLSSSAIPAMTTHKSVRMTRRPTETLPVWDLGSHDDMMISPLEVVGEVNGT